MDASLRDIERTMADHLRVSVLGTSPEALASELIQAIGPMVIAYRAHPASVKADDEGESS